MQFIPAVFRKLTPLTIGSQWKLIPATFKKFSSSTGYSPEEIEQFRKVFRTMPSYEESISSKDLTRFLQSINYIKSMETYRKHTEFFDTILGGRMELTQTMKYLRTEHDPRLLMNEYLMTFDQDNDGFISKEEFEFGMENIRVHDPRVRHVSYENFLKEADTNGDGKISVSKCEDWLNKYFVVE